MRKRWEEFKEWFKTLFLPKGSPASSFQFKGETDVVCSMLCIDDDKNFCHFMQKLSSSFGIRMDGAHTIQEAQRKIEENEGYSAFIIDGHLPDGSGFELVAWIREKKELSVPIVFISRIYQDAMSYRLLKESLKVNFILEKPIGHEEVRQLFLQLCDLLTVKTDPFFLFTEEMLNQLKSSYEITIPDKIERLEKLILDVQKNSNLKTISLLKTEVHKIAGSAGSYGYMAISNLCRSQEEEIVKSISLLEQGRPAELNPASLDEFFTRIKLLFQIDMPDLTLDVGKRSEFLPAVYVVDQDELFLKQFTHPSLLSEFEILTESNPENALRKIVEADFNPEIILFNMSYPSTSLNGSQLTKIFLRNNEETTNLVAMMVEEEGWSKYVQAIQEGSLAVVRKPFAPSFVLPLLGQILFNPLPLPFKVLVIDDDADICSYIVKVLKQVGLEVLTKDETNGLEELVKQEAPDLIVLDINLTDQAGRKILHCLRQDWGYANIIVGMLTLMHEETHLLQECYKENISDIIFKPLERGVIQRKIACLLKRQMREQLEIRQGSTSDWVNKEELVRYLDELCRRLKGDLFSASIVLFWARGEYEAISECFGELVGRYSIAAKIGEGVYALVFPCIDDNYLKILVEHALQKVRACQIGEKVEGVQLRLHPNENGEEIFRRCEDSLALARTKMNDEILHLQERLSCYRSKEVIIFNSDNHAIDPIQNFFKEKGFKVTVSVSHEIPPAYEKEMPLFIFMESGSGQRERVLLQKLIEKYPIRFPVVYGIPLLNNDVLLAFLSRLNYFEKPFGFSIFGRSI